MTNIKKCEDYNISLDLGVGSVGWAVQDQDGRLLRFKKRRTWGSRLFPEAKSAKDRRLKRSNRRRLARRKMRIDALQDIFADEIKKIEPEFFHRLEYSKFKIGDKDRLVPDKLVLPKEYSKYKTIYDLRLHLMGKDGKEHEKEDIRLIYLALHHICKYRGNYLYDKSSSMGQIIKDDNFDIRDFADEAVKNVIDALEDFSNNNDFVGEEDLLDDDSGILDLKFANPVEVVNILAGDSFENVKESMKVALGFDKLNTTTLKGLNGFYKALLGNKFDWGVLTLTLNKNDDPCNFALSNDDEYEEFYKVAPANLLDLLEATKQCYDIFALSKLLNGGNSISESMVSLYEQHGEDLKVLKSIYKNDLGCFEGLGKESVQYRHMFKGLKVDSHMKPYEDQKSPKNKDALGSYYLYIKGRNTVDKLQDKEKTIYQRMISCIKNDLEPYVENIKEKYGEDFWNRLLNNNQNKFLYKLRNADNGIIPYQLHKVEVEMILDAHGEDWPFLKEHRDEILSIIFAKIPYYVGPLNNYDGNSWNKRLDGVESCKGIRPWNWEEYINKEETAKKFITRMKGKCSYLYGEDALPARSLIYEEFKVRQELNGIKINGRRITQELAEDIFENMFKKYKTVTHKTLIKYLDASLPFEVSEISGTQKSDAFASSLGSLHDLKRVFDVDSIDQIYSQYGLSVDSLEEIIEWNTIFEDRDIFRSKLEDNYKSILVEKGMGSSDISKIFDKLVRIRYKGWGNLSNRFLTERFLYIDKPESTKKFGCSGTYSIMDVLREGNPCRKYSISVLEQIKADRNLHFDEGVNLINDEYFALLKDDSKKFNIDELYTSPKWKRALKQTEKVVDEIVAIVNKDRKNKVDWIYPTNIFIETTRTEDLKEDSKPRNKQIGKMLTAMVKDYDEYQKASKSIVDEVEEDKKSLNDELNKFGNELSDLRYLYFLQEGKCLYSEKPLSLETLSQDCEIDHIIPESKGGADSILSNRALVLKKENQDKRNVYPVPSRIQNDRSSWWEHLKRIGAINDAKYQALTSKVDIDPSQKSKFAMRQLTETSQIIKFASDMLELKFSDKGTKIVKIRAGFVSKIRERYNFPKVRSLNNLHHAHDAYLVCLAGLFMQKRYPILSDENFWFRKYLEELGNFIDPVRAFGDDYLPNSNSRLQEWNFTKLEKMIENDLYCKDVFVSRMTGLDPDLTSFWEETLVSPRKKDKDGNKPNLKNVLKSIDGLSVSTSDNRLDAMKYGGNSTYQKLKKVAVLVATPKGKQVEFLNIDTVNALSIAESHKFMNFVKEIVEQKIGFEFIKILRDGVWMSKKFGTDIIWNNQNWIIAGCTGKNNVLCSNIEPVISLSCLSQFPDVIDEIAENSGRSFDLENASTKARISSQILKEIDNCKNRRYYNKDIIDDDILNVVFSDLVNYLRKNHYQVSKVDEHEDIFICNYDNFRLLSITEKCEFLVSMWELCNCEKIDVKPIEGGMSSKFKCCINLSTKAKEIIFVDKSVTGMYENRTDCSKWLEK